MNIKIKDYVDGDTAISYDDGKRCYEKILEILKEEGKVILDFDGVDYVITAFLNPIIGDLILNNGNDVMKNIEIKNATVNVLEKIKLVEESILLRRNDLIR